ncbi:alpha/beta hydrolase [Cellulomonas sp. WB94]|uniref:alpha/beta hydrolase n=1 Tax=Cellulomonas sp. WB94 TaxID=2173174 RepID=UPI003221F622
MPFALPAPASRRAADPSSAGRVGPRRGVLRAASLVAVVALVVAGCSTAKHQSAVPTAAAATSSGPTAATAGLERFYGQQLDWTTCGKFECAKATVPVDWSAPDGDVIQLALERQRATGGTAVGSLLVNPGGPGASGVDALESVALERISASVLAKYDVVGFDPRGVARSAPVTCADSTTLDSIVSADPDYSTPAGIDAVEQTFAAFGAACLANTGPLLGHVDTVSAAKDMDVLRAALGDDKLTYLGYSYGTQLGATYAALFPERVGRLVLDGALDPTLTYDETSIGQAKGFESALRAYVTDCQAGKGCPLTGSVDDGLAQIKALLDRARAKPLTTDQAGRRLTGSLAFTGIALPLYSSSYWTYLTAALTTALQSGDGSGLLSLADTYYERSPDGTYANNSTEAFWSIGCVDDQPSADPADMAASAAAIQAAAPTVGYFFAYGAVICAKWPVPEVGPLDSYAAEGAAPILVVGTTNDPATPYAWAESLSKLLSSGVLLTYKGEGHTAYGVANDCLNGAVDAYLLDGTVPADGTRC